MLKVKSLRNQDPDLVRILIDAANPIDAIGALRIPPITSWRFCDVMEIGGSNFKDCSIDQAIAITLKCLQYFYPKMTAKKIFAIPAGKFVSLFKFLLIQFETLGKLMEQLQSEPDADLINAGVDKLNRFGVIGLYYAISKNPTEWDAISESPFGLMYNKLMLDKTHSEIQRAYGKIMTGKK